MSDDAIQAIFNTGSDRAASSVVLGADLEALARPVTTSWACRGYVTPSRPQFVTVSVRRG
jgi:hypothetical protein